MKFSNKIRKRQQFVFNVKLNLAFSCCLFNFSCVFKGIEQEN